MAEILGLGCTHAPMILFPPEHWKNVRKGLGARIPDYQPPEELVTDLADDDGLTQDKINHQRIMDAFAVIREKLHTWKPDAVILIGHHQLERFTPASRLGDGVSFAGEKAMGKLADFLFVVNHQDALDRTLSGTIHIISISASQAGNAHPPVQPPAYTFRGRQPASQHL